MYLAAWDEGDQFEDKLEETAFEESLRNKAKEQNLELDKGQIRFFGGYNIGMLLQRFPAIIWRFFGLAIPLQGLEEWSSSPRLANPFQSNEAIARQIDQLGDLITVPGSNTRVFGVPGNGKTRMVLEALRARPEIADSVLYAAQAQELAPAFIDELRLTKDIVATVVVDETDHATAERLADLFARMPDGVRLVTIGTVEDADTGPSRVQIPGAEAEVLEAIILSIAEGLPEDTAREIAQSCEGSPKLAFLLAELIRANPELATANRYLAERSVRNALDRYLGLDPASIAWKAVSAVALLERLGWSDSVEDESVRLFEALGLDPVEARQAIDDLDYRFGVAPLAGRFRYVSPAALADYLAARRVQSWVRETFVTVLGACTAAMADSFARRLRRLSGILENRRIVEEVILGNEGPFRTLADTENDGYSSLLSRLSAPFRRATLGALQRIIADSSIEELRGATRCRRDLVNALEELLWPADTFEGAAELMLKLAVAENETWSNNATGMWTETFQTALGRTAAGQGPRVKLLKKAAVDGAAAARKLAGEAIKAGLEIGGRSRMGMPPTDVEDMPAQSWYPATYGEWADTVIDYLKLADELVHDSSPDVRSAAAAAIAVGADAALYLPRVMKAWSVVATSLAKEDFDLRQPTLDHIDWLIEREEAPDQDAQDGATEEKGEDSQAIRDEQFGVLREIRQNLQGDDFQSRLRWRLSPRSFRFHRDPEGADEHRKELDDLAALAADDPDLLQHEWPWMLARDVHSPEEFAERLGETDVEERLRPQLEALASESDRGIGILNLYDVGQAKRLGGSHLDARVTVLVHGDANPTQIFDLLARIDFTPERFAILVELFASSAIPGSWIRRFTYTSWRTTMSSTNVATLARAAWQGPDTVRAVVGFVWSFLHDHPEAKDELRELVLALFEEPVNMRADQMAGYDWTELAKNYVEEHPVQIGRAAVNLIATNESAHEEYLNALVRQAWEKADRHEFFEKVVAPWLDDDGVGGWWVRKALEHFPIHQLEVDYLKRWIEEKPDTRALSTAGLIGTPIGRPSDLHAMLLEDFGDHGLAGTFYSSLVSGVFQGSSAQRTKGQIANAQRWLEDERPAVREWARQTIQMLESMLEHEEKREQEERFI